MHVKKNPFSLPMYYLSKLLEDFLCCEFLVLNIIQ